MTDAAPVCCYCDAVLSCERCGREQPGSAAQAAPDRDALAKTICEATQTYWWQTKNQRKENRGWYDAADAVIGLYASTPSPVAAEQRLDEDMGLFNNARNEAFEEAAKLVEVTGLRNPTNVATAIRALAASSTSRAGPDGYNGCYRQAIAALNYLAQYSRPVGGQSQFNAEHLLQIANEMKRSRPAHPVSSTKRETDQPYDVWASSEDAMNRKNNG